MKTAFVDTGAWVALFSANDEHHERAVAGYTSLRAEGTRLFTSSDVVDETATRLRYDLGLRAALAFREAARAAVSSGFLRVVWVDARTQDQAWTLLQARPALELSLTDCTSAALARRNKIKRIFGFDGDFAALGFELFPKAG